MDHVQSSKVEYPKRGIRMTAITFAADVPWHIIRSTSSKTFDSMAERLLRFQSQSNPLHMQANSGVQNYLLLATRASGKFN